MSNEIKEIFLEESKEILTNLEADILQLEDDFDKELFNNIFRYVHTLKGSSGVAGITIVYEFAHQLENLMDLVRSERIGINEDIIDLLLDSLDWFKVAIFGTEEEVKEAQPVMETLLSRILEFITVGTGKGASQEDKKAGAPAASDETKEHYFLISATFKDTIYESGIDPLRIIEDLAEQGEIIERKVDRENMPSFFDLDPEKCYFKWNILLKSEKSYNQIMDIFLFVKDENEISLEDVTSDFIDNEDEVQVTEVKIGELLLNKGIITEEAYEEILEIQESDNKMFGELVIEKGYASEKEMNRVLDEQEKIKRKIETHTVRVDTVKLDNLMNLLGEIVIGQSSLSRMAEELEDETELRLKNALHGLDRITREFQEQIMSIRMIPIGPTFEQFRRFVRDTAKSSGKEIDFIIEGKETELDKTVIEKIGDPLKHMIRNSIDHGLESSEERIEKGKKGEGMLRLHAYHQEGYVYIEVSDDGRGINFDKAHKKAISLGLMQEDEEVNETKLSSFLFLPGFSTTEKTSDLSGRGVGMDVVKTNIEALRGSVEIASKKGIGTTFLIKLPLTLAIIEGMLVRVGSYIYIIPLLSIVESVRPTESDLKTVEGKGEVIMVRNEYVSLIRLYELFGVSADYENPWEALVVIVESGESKVGMVVDELLGQQQIVIRSLDNDLTSARSLSGAAVLGDGKVALIIDVHGLVGELKT